MEVDGANALELLFTPRIDRDVHALFLRQIGQNDSQALHVIIQDQAGFHLPGTDARVLPNVRLLPLPALQSGTQSRGEARRPREGLGLQPAPPQSAETGGPDPRRVAALAHHRAHIAALIGEGWLLDGANSGAPA